MKTWSLILALLCSIAASGSPYPPGHTTVTIDGEPETVAWYSLSDSPNEPAVGDLIEIDGYWLALGAVGELAFRHPNDGENVLEFRASDGSWIPVGIDEDPYSRGGAGRAVETFSDAEARGLWGVNAPDWTPELARLIGRCDHSRVCLNVETRRDEKIIPDIPSSLELLVVDSGNRGSSDDEGPLSAQDDLSRLKRLTKLRALIVLCYGAPLDPQWLEGAPLRLLACPSCRIANPEALSNLVDLRWCDLAQIEGLRDVAFVTAMPELRVLHVNRSTVEDLSALANHPAIEVVHAETAPITTLPDGHIPRLRVMNVLSTGLSPEAAAQFRTLNPQCELMVHWLDSFVAATRAATSVRVRSGGTCHRDPASEQTLFETARRDEIQAFIDMIQLDDGSSGFHCQCCGSPTVELRGADGIIVELGVHHGRSVRWAGGPWPGDARLTDSSARALSDWLADRGDPGPRQELEEAQRQEAEGQALMEAYERIIPAPVWGSLQQARSRDAAVDAFRNNIPDNQASEIAFRLLGEQTHAWNQYSGLDMFLLEVLLPSISVEHWVDGAHRVLDDAKGVQGVARWLMTTDAIAQLTSGQRDLIFEKAARAGLEHPSVHSRRITSQTLGRVGGAASEQQLLVALQGADRPIGDDEYVRDDEPHSDRAAAALALLALDRSSYLEKIKALLPSLGERDRAILERRIGN